MADRSISQREHFPPSVCSVAATHNPFLWFLHFYLSYLDLLLRCRYNQSFISRLTICCHSLLLLVNQSWSYCWFLLTNGCHCFSWLFSFSSILTNFIVYRSFSCLVQPLFFYNDSILFCLDYKRIPITKLPSNLLLLMTRWLQLWVLH